MRNYLLRLSHIVAPVHSLSRKVQSKSGPRTRTFLAPLLFSLLVWGSGSAFVRPVMADTLETAPSELTTLITQIDTAANGQDLDTLMQVYSEGFTNSDGLNYRSLKTSLQKLWENYDDLSYQTELVTWRTEGEMIIAETITTITGVQAVNGREMQLSSTIRAEQYYQSNQIVQQKILAEQTQITSGDAPPTVTINAPNQVKVGEEYYFDAIVQEPLGEQMLMGAIVQEAINPKNYFNQPELDWELLSAGGLFKLGRAPQRPENTWISAVLIRQGGITLVTHRLEVID